MSAKLKSDLEKKLYIIKNFDSNAQILNKDENTIVYAWDYFASKILSRGSIDHQICDKILSLDEMYEIDSAALKIATTWYQNKTIPDILTLDGINLGFLVEWEFFHYLIQTIKNYIMLEKILEKEKPDKVIIFGDIGPVNTIFDKHNIAYELKDSREDNNKFIMDYIVIKYDILGHPISFKISLSKFSWIKKQYEKVVHMILKLSPSKGKRNNSKKSYLLLEFNPTTYSDLLYTAKKNNINLKLLNFRRPAIWNINSLKIIMRSGCDIINMDIDKVLNDNKIKSAIDYLRNSDELDEVFSIRNKSFWFFIKDDFVNFCISRFSQALQEIKISSDILKNQKVDCVIGWNDALQTEKTIMITGKRAGIPTVVLQHGLFAHREKMPKEDAYIRINGFLPLVADYLCVWGNIMSQHSTKLGMKKENVLTVGSPRYDNFLVQPKSKIKEKKTILFATSGLANFSASQFTSEILEKYEKSLEVICSICKKFKEYELIVKLHPYSYDFIDVKNIIKKNYPDAKIIQNANMANLIENCDVLITYAQSTVLLEAMMLEKPTISIWLYDFISPEEDILFKYDAITVSTSESLESNLKKILTDKDFADLKVKNGKKFVNDYLSNQGNASNKLLKFLDDITSK